MLTAVEVVAVEIVVAVAEKGAVVAVVEVVIWGLGTGLVGRSRGDLVGGRETSV